MTESYKDHNSKEAAEEYLGFQRRQTIGWCPVIKEQCKTKCVCYCNGSVFKINSFDKASPLYKEQWRSIAPYCTHVLISGNINTYGN